MQQYFICGPPNIHATGLTHPYVFLQRRSQEFDLGGYKWVKETKQPHKKLR